MVGFLNAHGSSPCLFGGEFIDLSLVEDDEFRRRKVSVLDLPDHSSPIETEPFDHQFEETFWSSLMLGDDYDWDDTPTETAADWVARRYADVIELNDQLGYRRASSGVVSLTPTLVGRSRLNVRKRHWSETKMLRDMNPHRDRLRGKAHAK